MKLLLDSCVWGGAKAELQANGHDVLWTGDLTADPGDEQILAQAHQEVEFSSLSTKTSVNSPSCTESLIAASCDW